MTLKEALEEGKRILKSAGIEAPAVDAGVMLCHAARCDRAYIYVHGEKQLEAENLEEYMQMLEKRIQGMPVQYITGHCEFMSLDFIVRPGVLIPRQDTEILVEHIIDYSKSLLHPVKILDIGTGSGCIAVSLAYHIKDCMITAVDISQKAIDIAKENALIHNVSNNVEFIRSSLFDALGGRKFNIIVSNPPYICRDEIGLLQREIREFEPAEALDGGDDGLMFYRDIVEKAGIFLSTSGLLAFEAGYGQAMAVSGLLGKDYRDVVVRKDLSGIDRVVAGIFR